MAHLGRAISTIIFLALMFVGLGFVLVHLAGSGRTAIAPLVSWRNVLNGELTDTIDHMVGEGLPQTPALDSLAAGLSYRLLGDAGPQVRAGCTGWLFSTEELAETRAGDAALAQRVLIARQIRDQLSAAGIRLVVLPVRDKADLAGAQLCGLPVAEQARTRYAHWQKQSADLALDVVDMARDWPAPGFLRTDTHWNETGARHAADQVAQAITAQLGAGTDAITLKTGLPELKPGDLMRLAGLLESWRWSGPEPDSITPVSMTIGRSGGLLDDVSAPTVVLAGSSYSQRSGFIDFLQDASRREVAQKSQDGSGFAGALLNILMNEPHILKQTRLVVWEFPVRALTQNLTDAERLFLESSRPAPNSLPR